MFVNYREILEKLRGVNLVLYTELTPRSFLNISRLFTNIQFVSLHKLKLWWKSHLFCNRHFLIRSIAWPLFWYELSPENYIFSILVITIKLSTWSTQKRCVFYRSFDLFQTSKLIISYILGEHTDVASKKKSLGDIHGEKFSTFLLIQKGKPYLSFRVALTY